MVLLSSSMGRLHITMAFGKMINPMEYVILELTMF